MERPALFQAMGIKLSTTKFQVKLNMMKTGKEFELLILLQRRLLNNILELKQRDRTERRH